MQKIAARSCQQLVESARVLPTSGIPIRCSRADANFTDESPTWLTLVPPRYEWC
jgi:hypothetical protein